MSATHPGSSAYPTLTWSGISILNQIRPLFPNFWTLPLRVASGLGSGKGYEVRLATPGCQDFRCADWAELRYLFLCAYGASTFLPPSDQLPTIERLMSLFRSIRKQLRAQFTADEIHRSATGGWPSLKEVLLYVLTRRLLPEEIVETGVAQGVSSTFILEALEQNGGGHLTSVDLPNYDPEGYVYEDEGVRDPVYVKRDTGVGWLVPHELRKRWTLLLGPAERILPSLSAKPSLFYHDSKHTYDHMKFEFEWAWTRLPIGGILVSDDISWNDAFSDFLALHHSEIQRISTEQLGIALRTA